MRIFYSINAVVLICSRGPIKLFKYRGKKDHSNGNSNRFSWSKRPLWKVEDKVEEVDFNTIAYKEQEAMEDFNKLLKFTGEE